MADPDFFQRSGPFSLARLAEITGASLEGDGSRTFEDVAPLDAAGGNALSFLDNIRYKEQFARTKAGACIIAPEMRGLAPKGVALLLTATPYKAYALAAQAFYPDSLPAASIAPGAYIDPSAQVGEGCLIEHGVVIGAGAQIGEQSWIEANTVIGRGVKIGKGCRIGANATIAYSHIGDNVRIYTGCRIGQDGFGFAIDPAGHVKVPQLGRVIIGDSVEIGANTTIDRGAGPDTVIGQGTWIDNLVQIGHNVKIGRGCVIVAQAGISGSTVMEDYAILAGQAGVAGHLHIGKGARIAAQSGILRDVPAGAEVMGYPAVGLRQFLRQTAALNRLVNKRKTD